ncbi:MAG: methyltransferase domain-containing protein [Anaerolineaceae bacterium]|nr:methyltransferase domain-containing protein [Anaerolineaceae bacterium]
MPLAPNFIERLIFLNLNQAPAPLLDTWSGPTFWSVLTALKLHVFETLATGAKSPQELAQAIAASEKGVTILLNLLASLGYVRQREGRFSNTAMTKKWLLDSGTANFTPFFLYWGALMEHFMPRLADSIRTGEHLDFYGWIENQPEISRHFQEGMIQLARFIAADVAKAFVMSPGAKRLLDVGGGHGEYSIALCKRNSDLSVTIFDGEQALVTGHRAVEQAELSDRIHTLRGDFMTGELPGGFDIALVFNIVHGLSPAGNVDLFRKVKATLNPGGQMVVLEQVHGISPLPLTDAASHILSLAYYHLVGGQVYTADEIQDWLVQAGFSTFQRKSILKASSALFIATV